MATKNTSPKAFLLIVIAGLLLAACKKHDRPPADNPVTETVTATLHGRVVDENNLPVKDAQIVSGTANTTTDINGAFDLKNVQLSKRFGYVEAKKAGYLTGSRTVVTTANGTQYVEIELLPKTAKGNFQAGSGGTVTVAPGCTVAFEPNAIVNAATGAAYAGTVNVYGAYLDPTSDRLSSQMPGDLRGLQAGTTEVGLETYGMANIELEGGGGEKLQLASGKKATINFPLPAALQAAAPASIPLWFFDAAKGTWVEEGSAAKQGSGYTGTVSHFSWWNCDYPTGIVRFKLKLIDQAGNPVGLTLIRIRPPSNLQRSGYTNSVGELEAVIPKNEPLQLEVVSRCNAVVHTRSIGPYSADADLGTVPINVAGDVVVFTGAVTNCSSQPIAQGVVDVQMEGINYRTAINNGNFSVSSYRRCATTPTTAEVKIFDASNGTSLLHSVQVTSGTVNLTSLNACTDNSLISMLIDGVAYNVLSPLETITCVRNGTNTAITGKNNLAPSAPNYLQTAFSFNGGASPGPYNLLLNTLIAGTASYKLKAPINCTITKYGAVGDFVEGTFSGTLISRNDSLGTGPTKALQASFKAKRTQ